MPFEPKPLPAIFTARAPTLDDPKVRAIIEDDEARFQQQAAEQRKKHDFSAPQNPMVEYKNQPIQDAIITAPVFSLYSTNEDTTLEATPGTPQTWTFPLEDAPGVPHALERVVLHAGTSKANGGDGSIRYEWFKDAVDLGIDPDQPYLRVAVAGGFGLVGGEYMVRITTEGGKTEIITTVEAT